TSQLLHCTNRCAATRCQRIFCAMHNQGDQRAAGNSTQRDVRPRRFAENGITPAAGSTLASGRHDSRVLLAEPIDPVGPPTSAMLVSTLQEGIERTAGPSCPVLVFLR